ncbi:unnamed protein product [Porites evermanni]|uniref:C2 NT-type domain-containing protein n=1 Tax=Porites evermanni TaxID=104178 RepID=A0ABN8M4W1_9CNID|nr:unnamed protein product [Porites evermanni]
MSSVIQKIKRNKSNARDFQITASVNLLTIECQADKWHPNKLIILWGKENNSCQTKPVPWQPGFVNPYRGTHVWPEPDPVKNTFKLFKNPKRAGTYEDRPWRIVVQNECENGRRQVIATGCIDLADYISETNKTFEITVTLKPAMKKVLSATIEFNLTSVMLEDGIPYRSDEEIFQEIMADAFRSAKNRIAKSAVSSAEHKDPLLFSSVDKPSEIPYTPRKRKNKKRRSKERANNTPGSVNNGREREAKVEKKISQPQQPGAHSNCHKTAESVTCAEDNNNSNLKAITPSADEGKESSNTDTPANVEGKKESRKTKSPKDSTSSAASKPAEQSLASNGVLSTKPETTQVSEQETRNNLAPEQGEEKASLEEVPSIPSYRRKLAGFIKGKKQLKASGKETSKLFPKEDGSSGCGGNVDEHYGSGTSGQLTAPKIDMSAGERKENTSADSHDDKEMISSFFKKLLENGPKKAASVNYPELSAYVSAEMKSLDEEIASLEKVTVKLESEMRQAMEIKECKEELDGLKQDWMILLSYGDQLKERKADLQILEKQENLEHCCDILRKELKLLFTLEDWRRTDYHTMQEAKLLDILHCLKDKQRETC